MEIPNNIKILGKSITVKKVHPIDIDGSGDWDGTWQTIRLESIDDPKFPESKMAEAFLHEIIEALNDFCDLKIPHQTISTLSETLFQVIRSNNLKEVWLTRRGSSITFTKLIKNLIFTGLIDEVKRSDDPLNLVNCFYKA